MTAEVAVTFECEAQSLIGIVHRAAGEVNTGVLIVVGGPQYRVGSHRQFLLLARYLAQNGIPTMRFDYRGMGDSEGELRTFEDVESDIRAAIDCFFEQCPDLKSVVLWGLCDAATAAAFYAYQDARVSGLVLLNPWVHSEEGEAKAYLKHYYVQRLFEKAFWKKIISGKFNLVSSLTSLWEKVSQSRGKQSDADEASLSLSEQMYNAINRFDGAVNIILSGDDLTAAEFQLVVNESKAWQRLLEEKAVGVHRMPSANHTFSTKVWRDEVAAQTLKWVQALR